ncbi:serine hydrolase domain-containing protein [Bergeyella sp. RCAD1439]|uniref:serine hydrolase domain-containing protein n=1 Tax=Bergeyella anatis TaxID=3113737 RepID=UPI002E19A5C8|nr:serine hydrolase domain-containing protein [Bergeyella sp. RCAD1439]
MPIIKTPKTTLYEKANGYENFTSQTPIDSSSIFAIGSVSKQFTAVLILLLQEEKKLKITDPAALYLPQLKTTEYQQLTIEQLLNHTSGLNDFGERLLFKSGTDYNYSNKGYFFLGKIIEKASGKTYEQNLKNLFEKAGLRTSFFPENLPQNARFASAHTGTTELPSPVNQMPLRLASPNISTPAGGLLSTTEDLHRWNKALFGGKIINSESLKAMTSITASRNHYILGNVGYGYGIMINPDPESPKAYFHTGYVKGSPSLLIYYPESQTSVVVLSNIADETKAKDAFFLPHKEVKRAADLAEKTASLTRKEKLIP